MILKRDLDRRKEARLDNQINPLSALVSTIIKTLVVSRLRTVTLVQSAAVVLD